MNSAKTNSLLLSHSISIAFRDSLHPLGVGANLNVVVEIALPLEIPLSILEQQIRAELSKWDHKHLGLDVAPKSYSIHEFAEKFHMDLAKYKALSLKLARADGWSLTIESNV